MTTIIKLVLALALITAAFQGARTMMNNYQFEDAVEQALLFAPNASDAEVVQHIVGLAGDYDLPIAAEDIEVSQHGADRVVNITYTTEVAFIPGIITQPITFKPTASVRLLTQRKR
jgi:hypothetical protein